MKRFKLSLSLFLVVLSVVFLTGCPGSGGGDSAPSVIANWSVTSVTPTTAAPDLQGGTFNFTGTNYTATKSDGSQYATGSYTISGNNITFAGTGPISGKTFSLSFSGANSLTLQGSTEEAGKAPATVTIVLTKQ